MILLFPFVAAVLPVFLLLLDETSIILLFNMKYLMFVSRPEMFEAAIKENSAKSPQSKYPKC